MRFYTLNGRLIKILNDKLKLFLIQHFSVRNVLNTVKKNFCFEIYFFLCMSCKQIKNIFAFHFLFETQYTKKSDIHANL